MRSVRRCFAAAVAMVALPAMASAAPPAAGELDAELSLPVQIMAGDKPIDVDVGHAAPFVHDFDGDGKRDLLVGQFGDGALRIYKNIGTDQDPKFAGDHEWFMAGGDRGTVPYG